MRRLLVVIGLLALMVPLASLPSSACGNAPPRPRSAGRQLGDSWSVSTRVIAADRYDDAPGPSRWIRHHDAAVNGW